MTAQYDAPHEAPGHREPGSRRRGARSPAFTVAVGSNPDRWLVRRCIDGAEVVQTSVVLAMAASYRPSPWRARRVSLPCPAPFLAGPNSRAHTCGTERGKLVPLRLRQPVSPVTRSILEAPVTVTNETIQEHISALRMRHYVLASAYPRDGRRFHVACQPTKLNEYEIRHPGGFALVLYKPQLPETYAYVVVPYSRVKRMFTPARRDADDGGWNAYVSVDGFFRTSADRTGEIDVTGCWGPRALPQHILALSCRGVSDVELETALQELATDTSRP
jgi:hypothetical protein